MEHFNPILGNDTTGQKFITCGEIMLRLTPPNYEKIRMASGFEASYGGSAIFSVSTTVQKPFTSSSVPLT